MAPNLGVIGKQEPLMINAILYFLFALGSVLIFSYALFTLKIYLQSQEINNLDGLMSVNVPKQKIDGMRALGYKKKIDDYSSIVNNHRISSNILTFIEENTLDNVWFSSFNMSQFSNEVKLSGEAENIETLGRQVMAFEKSQDHIRDVAVFQSRKDVSGRVQFTLNLYFNPKIFDSAAAVLQ